MNGKQEIEYEIVEENSGSLAETKKRGRKPSAPLSDELEAELAMDRRLAVIDERFGDGQLYERARVEVEVATHLSNSAMSYLQAGNRLVQLKEHEPHGAFMESIARIGISEDVCQRMMLTARKLEGTKLVNSVPARNLLPSKLYEIALFDQDQIEELDKTGAIGAITLDEIQRMTTKEVRAALREERERKKALEKIIAEKNEIINKQELQISLRPEPSEKEVTDGKLKNLSVHFISECVKLQTAMRQMRETLDEACRLPGLDLDKARLADFRDEIVRYGTEGVIAEWEVLTNEVENLMPKSESPDVPELG